MTTVLKLNPYPQPDISNVRNSLAVFNMATADRTFDMLKNVQQRVDGAGRILNGHTRTLFDQLIALEVAVESGGLAEVVNQWSSIKADNQLTGAQRDSGCEQIKGLYLKTVRRLATAADHTQSTFGHLLDEVAVLDLNHYADPLISFDHERLQQFEAEDTRLKADRDQLTEDMRLLQEAITLLKGSWWEHVKTVIPSASEIDSLVSAATVRLVDAQLIKTVLERVEKYVNFFEVGRKFSSLTTARSEIYSKLDIKNLEIKDNRKEIESLNKRSEKFERYSELLAARAQWVATFSSIREGVQQFSRICTLMSSATDEAIRQTPGLMADFLRFIRPLKR